MSFAEKLKTLRRQAGISQEKVAEKLNVSRQAVTKWESGAGIPDVENLAAVAALFGVSLDSLIGEGGGTQSNFSYNSVTEYDVDGAKRFDIKLGGAACVHLCGYEGEKLRICLASDALLNIQRDVKVKIDDVKNGIDVDVFRLNGLTEAETKKNLHVWVHLPQKYIAKIELSAISDNVFLNALDCDNIELDVKTAHVELDGVSGGVEIDCNVDMQVVCKSLNGGVEINQINCTSCILLPSGARFRAVKRGIGNTVSFEENGKKTESFAEEEAENSIGLNGWKSELIVCRGK